MQRIHIHRPRVGRERPWREVLLPDPRDPEVVGHPAHRRGHYRPALRWVDARRALSLRSPTPMPRATQSHDLPADMFFQSSLA
jgi:hypothetical protein